MDLEQFEVLELVNKIRNELLNHTGLDDKTVGKLFLSFHAFKNFLDLITFDMLLAVDKKYSRPVMGSKN